MRPDTLMTCAYAHGAASNYVTCRNVWREATMRLGDFVRGSVVGGGRGAIGVLIGRHLGERVDVDDFRPWDREREGAGVRGDPRHDLGAGR
jgi:hypothetical protein